MSDTKLMTPQQQIDTLEHELWQARDRIAMLESQIRWAVGILRKFHSVYVEMDQNLWELVRQHRPHNEKGELIE